MYTTKQQKPQQSRVIQRINRDGSNMLTTEATQELITGNNKGIDIPMTRHHIIPRNRLRDFWNNVKANNHLSYLNSVVVRLVDKANERTMGRVVTDLEVDGTRITHADTLRYMSYMNNNLLPVPTGQIDGAGVIEKVFQWWPANIHYGPTKRLSPGNHGYDINRDDGGDNFEVSAQKVVKHEIYILLKKVNDAIEEYNINPSLKLIKHIAKELLILSTHNSITHFDDTKWVYEPVHGRRYWRFN